MGKLVKTLVVLALLAVAIFLVVNYTSGGDESDSKQQVKQTDKKPAMQPQEKYGFAPVEDGNP